MWMAPSLTGSFLLGVVGVEETDTVYIANWHQPCYLALGDARARKAFDP